MPCGGPTKSPCTSSKCRLFFWSFGSNNLIMPPTLKKLKGHLGFGLSLCPFKSLFDACYILWTVHARVLKFHLWFPHGKIADTHFFLVLSHLLEWCPFEKIRMKSDVYHILWTVHVGFWSFIYGFLMEIAVPYFFLVRVISLSGVMPFEKIRMISCQQDISKSIWARGLKLD